MDLGIKPLIGLLGLMIAPLSAQDTVVFNTPGNLEATMPLGCVGLDSVTSDHTPADIFAGIPECIQREDYVAGIKLLLVARAYGRYDVERVSDVSAHEAIGMLAFQLGNAMTEAQREGWSIAADDDDPARRLEVCNALRRMGPPTYHPHYMIQHGLDAMQPWNSDSALVADFDPATAWTMVLEGYECIPPGAPDTDAPPAEDDQDAAARIVQSMQLSVIAKMAVSETWMSTGRMPETNYAAGLTDPLLVEGGRISIGGGGSVVIEFDEPPEIRGRTLVMTPQVGDYVLNWNCASETIPADLLPDGCSDAASSADQQASPPPPAAPEPGPPPGKPSASAWAQSKPLAETAPEARGDCAMEGVWSQLSDGQVQRFAWESTWVPAADGWQVSGPVHDAYGATELSGRCTRDRCELEQTYEQGELAGQSYQWFVEYRIQHDGGTEIEFQGTWGQRGQALGDVYASGVCEG